MSHLEGGVHLYHELPEVELGQIYTIEKQILAQSLTKCCGLLQASSDLFILCIYMQLCQFVFFSYNQQK